MRIYMIAGEASGDLHGGNLIRALKKNDPSLEIRCWGGDRMQEAGAEVVKHFRDLAFMGFAEVLMNLRTILGNLSACKEDIEAFRPDAIVFIDYPGFNLRIASWAREKGLRTFYYISPQLWAWKEGRVEQIRKNVDRMFVVLPFEKQFYAKHGIDVDFVGHPLLDEISERPKPDRELFLAENGLSKKPVIALLPGSRRQEIGAMLPVMAATASAFPDHQMVVAGAPSVEKAYYTSVLAGVPIPVVSGKTYDLLQVAEAGMITSGTATLEAALLRVPQVVCYKGNRLSYLIARQLVKVRFISLVNLILGRESVRELIQSDLVPEKLVAEMRAVLPGGERSKHLQSDYAELHAMLGGEGASQRTANALLKILRPGNQAS